MSRTDFEKKSDLEGESKIWLLSLSCFDLVGFECLLFTWQADLAFGFEAQRRDAILRTLVRNSYRFHLNEILATITNEYIDWER